MRLDKFLTLTGVGTRSEVKKILKTGAVTVNGIPGKKPEQKVDMDQDRIAYQGRELHYEKFVALMFHKPAGCVTATSDRTQKTVMDYITHERKDELFPVGRLDIDTEGLLLLMNDGELAHRMLSPKRHVDKTYFVRVEGALSEADVRAFRDGIDIGEKQLTLPAVLTIKSSGEISEAEVTICEGKFHQVKRMFAARGCQVIYLKRISMAGIALDENLRPGEFRELTAEEKRRLTGLKAVQKDAEPE
jgi:16S rRNA pseudouridine516 synthase